MQTIIMAHPWEFDRAALSGAPGAWRDGAPLENLQDCQPSRVARTTDLTSTYFVVDAGEAVAWTVLALIATNLSATATVRVRCAATESDLTASPAFDSTAISAWPVTGRPTDPGMTAWSVFKTLVPGGAYRYWRVDIADGDNAAGYVEIGRAILAPAFQPRINISYGGGHQYNPADIQTRTSFGHILPQARLRPRSFQFSLDYLSEAELLDGIDEFARLRGLAEDLVCCIDPDATTYLHKRLIHGLFSDVVPMSFPDFSIYSAKVGIVELV